MVHYGCLEREARTRERAVAVSPPPPADTPALLVHSERPLPSAARASDNFAASSCTAPWCGQAPPGTPQPRFEDLYDRTGAPLSKRRMVVERPGIDLLQQFAAGPQPCGGGGGGGGGWSGVSYSHGSGSPGEPSCRRLDASTFSVPLGHPAERTALAAAAGRASSLSYSARYTTRRRFTHASGQADGAASVASWFRPAPDGGVGSSTRAAADAAAAPRSTPGLSTADASGSTQALPIGGAWTGTTLDVDAMVQEPPVVTELRDSIRRASRVRRSLAADLTDVVQLERELQQEQAQEDEDEDEREHTLAAARARLVGLRDQVAGIDWMVRDLRSRGVEIQREQQEDREQQEQLTRERRRRLKQKQQQEQQYASGFATDIDSISGLVWDLDSTELPLGDSGDDAGDDDDGDDDVSADAGNVTSPTGSLWTPMRHTGGAGATARGHAPELQSLLRSMLRPRRNRTGSPST
jgi:hypothetical protein